MITFECFECAGPAEQKHHVVPRSKGGTKTVWLCVNCHGVVHGKRMAHNYLTKAALQAKKERGERCGNVPHGYISVNGKLIPDEKEQQAMRIAREMRHEGQSFRFIADALFDMGFMNKVGRKFNPNSVRNMISYDA